ncbi:hypothetical protein ACS0TY_007227 [Phlomoides rotata]
MALNSERRRKEQLLKKKLRREKLQPRKPRKAIMCKKNHKKQTDRNIDPHVEEQFSSGKLLACISSRPGQCGYILEEGI